LKTEFINKTGITKRFFNAYQEFNSKSIDIENILFQLCSVIDSTAKVQYPNERRIGKRFSDYLDSNYKDIFYIMGNGLEVGFGNFESFYDETGTNQKTIGKILWAIRNCSYHDPEELSDILEIDNTKNIIGFNKIGLGFVLTLFLILWTDVSNKERIKKDLIKDSWKFSIRDKKFLLKDFIGQRDKLKELYKQ